MNIMSMQELIGQVVGNFGPIIDKLLKVMLGS